MEFEKRILKGRVINEGEVRARVVKSSAAISFFGGVDPETGNIVEKGHPQEGKNISGKIFVFPYGKGSTVGSYILYRMAKNGTAPAGLIMQECDSVIAVGAVIGGIPCIDRIDINSIEDDDDIEIEGENVILLKGKNER